jgi:hypothetical protein
MHNELIPPEIKGKNINLESTVELASAEEAQYSFQRARNRMLNPDIWHRMAGRGSAEFVLTNRNAEEEHRLARKGDLLKIDIPGPGPSAGDGYDWVTVESIEEINNPGNDEESCGMKLKATSPPAGFANETAHFFDEGASSSFIVHRKGNKVTASYHGRNEVPNTAASNVKDKVRNVLVSIGAMAGISELQWKALIKGFLEKETDEE